MFLFSLTCSLFLFTSFGHALEPSDAMNVWRKNTRPLSERARFRRMSPTVPPATDEPTASPTTYPTGNPSAEIVYSTGVTPEPTTSPTTSPTTFPTDSPTVEVTPEPTTSPTTSPTTFPTGSPTMEPTAEPTAPVLEDSDSDGSGMAASSVLGISGGLFVVLVLVVVVYLLRTGAFGKKASQENQENLESGGNYTTAAGSEGDDSPSINVVTETPGADAALARQETLNVPTPAAQNPTSDSDFVSPRKMPTPKEASKKDTSGGSGRSSGNRVSLGLVSMMSPKKIKTWTKDDGEQPSSPLMGSSANSNNVTSLADIEAVLTGRDPKAYK